MSLAGIELPAHTSDELRSIVGDILARQIHGVCFSPYVEGQGPGTDISEAQIRQRMRLIAPHVRWIRSFSCSEGHEHIPRIAAEYGLKTMVGVWLDADRARNAIELDNAIEIARQGYAGILAVGNEVLLRGDLPEPELISYIERAKGAGTNVPVGYVDAYFKFADHPSVTRRCDLVLANCYPFWEECAAEHALLYMKEMYRRAVGAAGGKKVIISETGWPSVGTAVGNATPSYQNAVKYFVDTYRWAEQDNVEIFYFSAFDETWKVDKEGDVGAYWGLWDKSGHPKYT